MDVEADSCLKDTSNTKFKFLKIIYETLHNLTPGD